MAGLPIQPLEVNDFSGGITDNYLQGDPRRYQYADNLLITDDKKLEERMGIVADGVDSYQISYAAGQRINGYYSFVDDSVLMAQNSRNLSYKNASGVWTRVLGVDAKEALSSGSQYSQTTYGEFQKQVYLTTDDGSLPSKIYKDSTNTWVARTAGLPRSWVLGNYTASSLLAKCIGNANALKASMISHFSDAKYPVYQAPSSYEVSPGILHINIDRRALCYLQAVTFGLDTNVPSPLPTPAPDATDQASLFILVSALNSAYTNHVFDAMKNSWVFGAPSAQQSTISQPLVRPLYHQDPPVFSYTLAASDHPLQKTKGPGAPLEANATPDELEEAAAMLDDLLQKWNWHRKSVNTHDELNRYAIFNRYEPAITKIGTIQLTNNSFPTITPDWGDLYGYVNNLRYIYNSHVTNLPGISGANGTHKQRDNSIYQMQLECTLPECTDLDSMYLLIYWLRNLYTLHSYDAQLASLSVNLVYTSTVGTSATPVTVQSTGVSIGAGAYQGMFFFGQGLPDMSAILNTQQFQTPTYKTARIVSNTLGAMVIDHNFLTVVGGSVGQATPSQYHGYFVSGQVANNPTWPTALGPEAAAAVLSNDPTIYGTDTSSWLDLAGDLFVAMNAHMTNNNVHAGAGFNQTTFAYLISNVPYQVFQIPTISTVSYAMYFSDTYTTESVDGIEYLVNGNPIFSDSTEIAVSYPSGTTPVNPYPALFTQKAIVTQRGNVLSNLPVLVNDSNTNYAVSNVKLNIYRTTDGGTTFFKVAEVANGTTSYTDIINDSIDNPGDTSLDSREPIYTSGGVVGSDQPPISKYAYILDSTAYWAGIEDTGQFFPNRIRQSNKNQPDSAPATFNIDLDSEIVGLSSARGKLIAHCKTRLYRIEGGFNTQGQGSLTSDDISDTLGTLNAKSIVRTEIGVFYAGTDGFYYTDGYQNIKISLELEQTYLNLTASDSQKRSIYGAYDKETRRVWWAMKESSNGSDNSVIYVYYLNYGVKPSGVFTRIINGLNLRPSSLVFQKGVAYIAHEKGYLLKTDVNAKWDALVVVGQSALGWQHGAIPYNYTSTAVDMGTIFNRKWITKIHVVGKNEGNQAIQPYALRDVNQTEQGAIALAPINYKENLRWNDARPVWGDASIIWKTSGKMDVWRRFPKTTLRSDFMQVVFKPSDAVVYSSSGDYPNFCWATINEIDKKIAIITPSGYSAIVWPTDMVGYRIKFSNDGYVNSYTITGYNDVSTIFVSDPLNTLVQVLTPGVEWEVWGTKKEQKFTLTSYVLHYGMLGTANQAYPGAKTGDGPGNGGGNPS